MIMFMILNSMVTMVVIVIVIMLMMVIMEGDDLIKIASSTLCNHTIADDILLMNLLKIFVHSFREGVRKISKI